ncbi:hypothetical protein ABZU78_25710 [Rhodococcus erythropolis]|uniref:hypothetical protein n=1 Tax=Rhodococcus erythropolis TaxID=1833 RepID=UPI0033ABD479
MDAYDRTARLSVAYITAFPLSVLAVFSIVDFQQWWLRLVVLGAGVGLPVLLIDLVRDLGVRTQADLWDGWGGPPTTVLLRWSSAPNPMLQQLRHRHVQRATGVALPTASEEAADPGVADQIYETAVSVLRQRARAQELVARENRQYGLRRNLYGCRLIARAAGFAAAAAGASLSPLAFDHLRWNAAGIVVAISVAWILGSIVVITSSFVKKSADRYAETLISAASEMEAPIV